MTTPKRNEAVALWVPNGHTLRDGSWEPGPGELVSIHEASDFQKQHGFPLYPQSALDALQGEVSRLREALLHVRAIAQSINDDPDEATNESCDILDHIDALNLEPPTDGQ